MPTWVEYFWGIYTPTPCDFLRYVYSQGMDIEQYFELYTDSENYDPRNHFGKSELREFVNRLNMDQEYPTWVQELWTN